MKTVIKPIFLICWLLGLSGMILIWFYNGMKTEFLIYWWVLVGLIFGIWLFRLNIKFLLWGAFLLFLFSALFVTVGLQIVAEILMRLSFTAFLVGIMFALLPFVSTERSI